MSNAKKVPPITINMLGPLTKFRSMDILMPSSPKTIPNTSAAVRATKPISAVRSIILYFLRTIVIYNNCIDIDASFVCHNFFDDLRRAFRYDKMFSVEQSDGRVRSFFNDLY
jgi:hypothetical protein